jgi:hypothetical protein
VEEGCGVVEFFLCGVIAGGGELDGAELLGVGVVLGRGTGGD